MIKFNLISIFPEMFSALTEQGLVGQAVKSGKIAVELISPRTYTTDFHKTVDDRPYGGGDGMVMLSEPLRLALEALEAKGEKGRVILMSPQGRVWSDSHAREWAGQSPPESQSDAKKEPGTFYTLICARYGGVDQRFINAYVDEEISVGDFVLTGGELAAMILVDSMTRFVPGVLGNSQSAEEDSFSNGLLESPLFTRPPEVAGQAVPEILKSGNHKKILEWRKALSLLVTAKKRPDLLSREQVSTLPQIAARFSDDELAACGIARSDLEIPLYDR